MNTSNSFADRVQRIMTRENITMSSEFVPASQTDHPHAINWRVTFRSPRSVFSIPYSYGYGVLIGYYGYGVLIGYKTQHGTPTRALAALGNPQATGTYFPPDQLRLAPVPVPPPALADVLRCILLDSDVRHYESFGEFALNMGYDTDSRSAERVYNDCILNTLRAMACFGNTVLEELEELMAHTDE